MRKMTKMVVAAATLTMLAASIMGCGSEAPTDVNDTNSAENTEAVNDSQSDNSTDGQEDTAEVSYDDLSGSITMAGSTSMEKVANALSEAFMEAYPNVTVTAEFTGSGAGLESLAAGSVDIGNASRSLSEDELATGAVENVVAIDGIAVITDVDNTVTGITSEELAKIYKREITNWSELGGQDADIVVIGREAGSGTRGAFEELLEIEDQCQYAQELDSTGAVLAKVAATPGSIGYVSLDVLDGSVLAMKVNDVEPTEENIVAGDYLLSRPFVMATKGEISEQNELVQAWFAYIKSEEGKSVIKKVGLIIPEE